MLLLLLILIKSNVETQGRKSHQSLADDFQDITYRDFKPLPKIDTYINSKKMEEQDSNNIIGDESTKRELQEAKNRILELEKKIAILEGRVPQKYPDVKFLGYKERKRILVSLQNY